MPRDEERAVAGWKSIARFLGCSERTARRWACLEGLPIYFPCKKSRKAFAYRSEMRIWIRGQMRTNADTRLTGSIR